MAEDSTAIQPKQLGRMVARMRLREGVVEVSQRAELMPIGLSSPEAMRQQWGIGLEGVPQKKGIFLKSRQLYKTNDWVGSFVDTMILFCNDGFAINGVGADATAADGSEQMRTWMRECGFDFAKLARDIFLERVLCDNAVLFWTRPDPTVLPSITVLDCEDVELCNAFGKNYLKITHKVVPLTQEEKNILGQRYAEALGGKPILVQNGELDEYFRYLTAEKNGGGLRLARLYQIFQDLSLRDMLKMGDWNAGWLLKNIIRLVRRGHDIKNGALAGQDIHFLKTKEAKKIKKGLATNVGAFDMVTNFDLTISYSYMDAKYLDTAKYEGVKARLASWAGPVAKIMEGKQVADADAMKMFEVQCCALRAEVGLLLNRLFNSGEFLGEVKPPAPIQVTWSANTFVNFKFLLEKVRLAQAGGASSTQTAREDLGYDHERESARLKKEHEDPESVTPAFEQKQGMAGNSNKGGRPGKGDPAPAP